VIDSRAPEISTSPSKGWVGNISLIFSARCGDSLAAPTPARERVPSPNELAAEQPPTATQELVQMHAPQSIPVPTVSFFGSPLIVDCS